MTSKKDPLAAMLSLLGSTHRRSSPRMKRQNLFKHQPGFWERRVYIYAISMSDPLHSQGKVLALCAGSTFIPEIAVLIG